MDPTSPVSTLDERPYHSTARLLRLGLPLIVSHISVMAMQLVDTAFLARYSPAMMGAAGFGGMLAFVICGFFGATAGYTGTFVAQYLGEGRDGRVGPVVWQGLYLSLAFGLAMAGAGLASERIFAAFDHAEVLRRAGADYFRWLCLGGVFVPLGMCLTGFYAGRGDNRPILLAQLAGTLVNIALDYALIFGRMGFPEMGVTGAAVATVLGQATIVLWLGAGFFAGGHRRRFGTFSGRRPEAATMRRLLRFGLPQGFRTSVEVTLWVVFLYFIGKVGVTELAASQLAFRVNTVGFMPMVGFSVALTMLVGQAQGAGRPDLSRKAIRRCVWVVEAWMCSAALLFLLAPRLILAPLTGDVDPAGQMSADEHARVMATATTLLRFVAAYCLFDGFNIVFCSALQGAGDSWWTMKASIAAHLLATAVFWLIGESLYAQWTAATTFVSLMALVWAWRLAGGKWESIKVTESPTERRVAAESGRFTSRYIPE